MSVKTSIDCLRGRKTTSLLLPPGFKISVKFSSDSTLKSSLTNIETFASLWPTPKWTVSISDTKSSGAEMIKREMYHQHYWSKWERERFNPVEQNMIYILHSCSKWKDWTKNLWEGNCIVKLLRHEKKRVLTVVNTSKEHIALLYSFTSNSNTMLHDVIPDCRVAIIYTYYNSYTIYHTATLFCDSLYEEAMYCTSPMSINRSVVSVWKNWLLLVIVIN